MAQSKRHDQEEEVVPAIRHDDAEWKIIQQNTFTRWVNNHLQKAGESITSLETDLSDGLRLIALAGVLSHKNVGKFNRKVNFRSQKLENVSLALNFFQNEENIKIINIDSTHIVDHNKKLILGLIWTLILHYSISMGWIQEKRDDGGAPAEETPKQKLLNWVRGRLPGMPISNFTSDWNDGVALGALVSSMAPGELNDWQEWSPDDALHNTERAMKTAEDLLDVAPLIAPAEMIHPDIDEMSVMTYLSQFPATKPVVKKTPLACTISHLNEKLKLNEPVEFELKLNKDGYKPKITIRDSNGNDIHLVTNKDDNNVYKVKFTPNKVGPLNIDVCAVDIVTFESTPIPDATTVVQVLPNPRLVEYNETAKVGDTIKFCVVDALDGEIEAIIVDAIGKEHYMPVLTGASDGEYNFEYTVPNAGLHSINVFYQKMPLNGSPFPLRGKPKNMYKVWGRGTCDDGVRVNDVVDLFVASKDPEENVHNARVDVNAIFENGTALPVEQTPMEDGSLRFSYSPTECGSIDVDVNANGDKIESFKVDVGEKSECRIRAFGPGLTGGIVNEPCMFDVVPNGEKKNLSFAVEGPSKTEIALHERPDGSAIVSYTPTEQGVYKVSVWANGEHIKDSPFVLRVREEREDFKPSAARVTGIDESKQYSVGDKLTFRVDTRLVGADIAPTVEIVDGEDLTRKPYGAREITPGLFEYNATLTEPKRLHAVVSVADVAVPGSPFAVDVVDASKVRIYGDGVSGPVYSKEPTRFTIDAKQAGPGAVEVALTDGMGEKVDLDVLDHHDGSFTVKYTAPKPGAYQLNVIFAGDAIAPIEINVKPRVDTSGIRVEGLENGEALIGTRLEPKIDIGRLQATKNGLRLFDEINGKLYNVPLEKKSETEYAQNFLLSVPGTHKLKVLFDDEPVYERCYEVKRGSSPDKVKVTGDGLREAIVNEPSSFDLDINGAGEGSVYVEMKGPSKSESKIIDHGNGRCTVDYIAHAPGEYEIAVQFGEKYEKKHVPGSPFFVNVDHPKDASAIVVRGLDSPTVRVNHPVPFVIDASGTKAGSIKARLANTAECNQPVLMTKSPRVYAGEFTATSEDGVPVVMDVLYDGEPIPNGQFVFKVVPEVEPEKMRLKAKEESVAASHEATVELDVRDCGHVEEIQVELMGPDGKKRPCNLKSTSTTGLYEVGCPTDAAGEYMLYTYVNGTKVNSPHVFEAKKILEKPELFKCEKLEHPKVAENRMSRLKYTRPVVSDSKNKKNKRIEANVCVVVERPEAVDIDVKKIIKDDVVNEEVIFVPTRTGPNTIDVYYGGEHVDHVEYEAVEPVEFEKFQEERARRVVVEEESVEKLERYRDVDEETFVEQEDKSPPSFAEKQFKFNLRDSNCSIESLEASVMPPTQKKESAQIIDNHDGTILVKYVPKVSGSHELSIVQNGAQLQGTPIKFFVDSYGDGYATVYGTGLQSAIVGEPAAFTVCAKGSHAKELSVSIEGPATSNIKIHDNKDGTCSVAWVPPVPGEYKVHVKLGGKEVRDSPFKVLVMGEGQKRSHLSVGSTSEVALPLNQLELKGISASIKSPSGIEEPCFVRLLDGGKLGVSFTPRENGDHLITVKRDGKLLPKAPFKIKVDKSQVGDASKVEVSGSGKAKAVTLQANELIVDTTKAGYGGLSVSVQGPSKAELTCKEMKPGIIKVLYTPTEPGVYAIAIKFADHHVKDSPLTVQCSGKGAGRVVETIQRRAEQHAIALPDQESHLFLKLPNTSPMDINAKLMNPKGQTEDIEMRDLGGQYYQMKFTPKMEGVHTLSVMYKDSHVNGSPFQFTVGSFSEGGAHKVRAAGQGVVRGETGTMNSFNVYHREAGAGNLSVAVEGPSKATLKFEDHKDGNCHVDYKVTTPGEYLVAVKFNDQHIPDSPFKVFVAPATGEVRKLELAQFHDQGVPSGKAFTFTVLTHRAKGHLEAKVVGPNNEVETIDIVPIEDGESYAMRFVPKETGNHYIHVTLDGAPMRDSPFRLRVGGKDLCDPTAISATGDGLVKGSTGQKCEFIVNTANAGAGILTVQMEGPSKATLDAYELEKGYKVRYTPLAPGDYFASVKYNGIHVPGSPFKIPVDGKELGGNGYNETSTVKIDAVAKTSQGTVAVVPEYHGDASKVTAKGAGLNKFFPNRPAAFQIDTGLAGNNLLMVGVVTSKGPCEEVVVRHQGQGHYVCTYRIPDRVKGFIFIKYGDKEIPGSPFAISP